MKNILVVEDDEDLAEGIGLYLTNYGFTVTLATDGMHALELLNKDIFQVLVTDLNMPRMNGRELIQKLPETNQEPIILMLTGDQSPEMIVEIMKLGVFDYIFKPVTFQILEMKVTKAFEQFQLMLMHKKHELETQSRVEKQLEMTTWKKMVQDRSQEQIEDTIFSRLQQSFNQGSGFGSLISMVSLIPQVGEKDGEVFKLPVDFANVLLRGAEMATVALDEFVELGSLMSQEMPTETTTIRDILDIINKIKEELEPMSGLREQNLVIGELKEGRLNLPLQINLEYFRKAVKELLLNSFKFSPPNTSIYLIYKIQASVFTLSILNVPQAQDNIVGIPPDYEKIIFEPFFRISKVVDERYNSLDYGLGLTIARKIFRKHGGNLQLFNVKDYLSHDKEPGTRTSAEASLPLSSDS